MASVTLESLQKTYNENEKNSFHAVKGIDLAIHDQEFMVFVGPSGCGKSTVLRMIAGLEDATSGTISIGNQLVNDVCPRDRDIAMVFQNYALYPNMTVFQNMGFGLKLMRHPKKEIRERVHAAADMLGLADMLDRKPQALSGGQRQRVALGRAIVRQPKVFLFDEPLSNLDAKMRVQMRAEIMKLHNTLKTTMIYVTHDQVEAMTMGTRMCVMNAGEIMQVGEPLAIYHRPANTFVAQFIGSPPMNIFPGRIERKAGNLKFVTESTIFDLLLSGELAATAGGLIDSQASLGIRPEQVNEVNDPECKTFPWFEAKVELSEPMGSDTVVHLSAGSNRLIARLPSERLYAVGASIRLSFDPSKAILFDSYSKAAKA